MTVPKRKSQGEVSSSSRPSGGMVAGKRKTPRAPLLTQVEAEGERRNALGRASNISVGGLLIETPDTLPEGTPVIVRFFISPDRHPIEAAGRVVRVEPGKSMAVAFRRLLESHQQKINDYIKGIQGGRAQPLLLEARGSLPRQRRSHRVRLQQAMVLSWQDEEGRLRQDTAEIRLVSKHGAQVLSFTELQPGQLVRVALPASGKEATASVVWSRTAEIPGRMEVGLEFVGFEDFWSRSLSPDPWAVLTAPRIARRRSARLPRSIDVILKWVDEEGRRRKYCAQTRLLSRHGAQLSSRVALAVRQQVGVRAAASEREAKAHVIWVAAGEFPGWTDLGVEFLEVDDFWGIAFPPDPGSPPS